MAGPGAAYQGCRPGRQVGWSLSIEESGGKAGRQGGCVHCVKVVQQVGRPVGKL